MFIFGIFYFLSFFWIYYDEYFDDSVMSSFLLFSTKLNYGFEKKPCWVRFILNVFRLNCFWLFAGGEKEPSFFFQCVLRILWINLFYFLLSFYKDCNYLYNSSIQSALRSSFMVVKFFGWSRFFSLIGFREILWGVEKEPLIPDILHKLRVWSYSIRFFLNDKILSHGIPIELSGSYMN